MNFYKNEILLSIESPYYGGLDSSRQFIQELKNYCQIVSVSSAYKVIQNTKSEVDSKIVLLLHVRSSLVPELLIQRLDQMKYYLAFKLLTYNQEISMTPTLTLPHPDLTSEGVILCCAAELLPNYIHPILKKELGTLSLRHDFNQDAEFYLQGKTFLE